MAMRAQKRLSPDPLSRFHPKPHSEKTDYFVGISFNV